MINQQKQDQDQIFEQELMLQYSIKSNNELKYNKLDKGSSHTNQITEQKKLISGMSDKNDESLSQKNENSIIEIQPIEKIQSLDQPILQQTQAQDKFDNQQDEELSMSSNEIIVEQSKDNKQMHPIKKLKYFNKRVFKKTRKLQKSVLNILFKRKLFRIILLVAIEVIVLALVIIFFNNLGYCRGQVEIYENDSIQIQVNRCVIKIIDQENKDKIDLNYLSRASLPATIDGNILMVYSFPDPLPYKKDYSFSDLSFLTFQGNFEVNNFQFSKASVETQEGDIIIQSLQSITATVQLTNKYYCISTYSQTPIQNTITSNPASCTLVFPYGTTDLDPKNMVAERCISGSITIPSNIGGNQNLVAKNTFGNLFINVLQNIGQAADQIQNAQYVYDQTIYGKNGDQIQFSTNSLGRLNNQMESASNPNVYDPIFIIRFGSSQIESNTYSQWQITYNPAYSYFKPYWLGTLTVSLLNSQRYEDQYVLAPGFCPYVNSLSQKRLNTVKELLKTQFKSQQNSAYFIYSLAWQSSISLPPIKFTQSDTYSSLRDISLSDNYVDDWIDLNKNSDGSISTTYLDVSQSGVLEAAIIVSFILACIVGLTLIVGIVYVINVNYNGCKNVVGNRESL